MNAEDLSVIQSSAARKIQADCRALASEVGVPLESVSWSRNMVHTSAPFLLNLKVSGISPIRQLEFTQEEIERYPTGQTTTAVKEKMRAQLAAVLPDLEEH
jgi:hypothetical protein